MQNIKDYFTLQDDVVNLIEGLNSGMNEQLIAGMTNTARQILISSLHESTNRPVLYVTHNLSQAQKVYDELLAITDRDDVYLYPVNELLAAETETASPELKAQRLEVWENWQESDQGILVAPVSALKRVLPPVGQNNQTSLDFKKDEVYPFEETIEQLVNMGYKLADMVTSPGEMSRRGGIIDIYPLTENFPIRMEWFDDELESVRYFDADNQRSREELDHVSIGPVDEFLLTHEQMERGAERLKELLAKSLNKLKKAEDQEKLRESISYDIEQMEQGEHFPGMIKYLSLIYDDVHSLVDYMSEETMVVFDEISRVSETAEQLDREEANWYTDMLETQSIVNGLTLSFDWATVLQKMTHQKVYFSLFLRHIPYTKPENIINISSRQMQTFHGQMPMLKGEIERWRQSNYSVVICAADDERMDRIVNVLDDYGMLAHKVKQNTPLEAEEPLVVKGQISQGFEIPTFKLAVLTEEELFKKRKPKKQKKRQKLSNAERIKSYQELKTGDYVVHINHGIGKYLGIETLEVNDLHKDYMVISYSGNDKLYVPVEQIDQVQKYVGSEGKEPKLYRLGGSEWKKVKSRVKSSVEDIADDLIKLYAEREASKGYAFSEDTEMQRDFEAAFPYEETEDQLRCIEEIKADMEKERPMDRLLCGDVGYGKTEVAIRAAFKAIIDNKQAAVLVPTTILAQQHFETFQERFQDFGVNIGLLSRFATPKQQKDTLDKLKKGLIDIVIGTHRVLSNDVKFKDLGLLIVDEEQRFGVKHKEKIKQLKANVDVLTLTATPIPRTLHMSMVGVRDLSVIETPPENRFPIQTYVLEYNPAFIREAIERELARGGQVFFLYNRVDLIEKVAAEIDALVEDARINYAHGQMNERQLEGVMFDFLEGNFDVLVSTTIIETGVDIPNVNTLIVYDADRMGLSQLYQLRGRVGRSNRLAYAYFTYQQNKVLSEVAEKRLEAIKEFTELGSGFKIAMRDLSIRGAGNLLGTEQHGFIDSVGFDMYSKMLNDAIQAKKKGKTYEEVKPFEVEMSLDLDAYIPSDYITDETQKIEMYKQIQAVENESDIYDIKDELIDRFGEYPQEVEDLLQVSRIRLSAKKERVETIDERQKKIELIMEAEESQKVDGAELFTLANEYGRMVQLATEGKKLKITLQFQRHNRHERYDLLEDFLSKLKQTKNHVINE
ncbi:transcription-repair coupling factor [Tenuibacillus multivorans]|uniref:Transcription-repair-coupling factor n=1 Tax=Tenuibacillus multivorans TaxID=237069 RepID=A0A1G9W036_9BACI|nr:transcription-repair coupling factor [Tenuibacillus multivorans]GEL78256.1 transcription-repair-coupling factor [Tenuibacillus multivorans]SDM77587.1 transcription-repair coupling factor (superfamily II helicase) [Tenuibacillus multivorans]